eukprot:6188318-Pleurochrysis_carterae.AAC.4
MTNQQTGNAMRVGSLGDAMRVSLSLTSCKCSMYIPALCASSSQSQRSRFLRVVSAMLIMRMAKASSLQVSINSFMRASLSAAATFSSSSSLAFLSRTAEWSLSSKVADGVQLVLVEVHNVLEVALEL